MANVGTQLTDTVSVQIGIQIFSEDYSCRDSIQNLACMIYQLSDCTAHLSLSLAAPLANNF